MRHSLFDPHKAQVLVLALTLPLLLFSSNLPMERDLSDSAYRSEARASLSYEERVAAQRSIEDVYWRHRIWPQSNAGPKPSLDEVMPESALRAKVEDYLRQSNALGLLWDRPITADQLQAEIDRMARDSRRPEVLTELYAALGNDPVLIAECLARPSLASRLIRTWFARDPRFHGELRHRAEQSLAGSRTIEALGAGGGRVREITWTRATEPDDVSDGGTEEIAFREGRPRVVRLDAEGWNRLQWKLEGWSAKSIGWGRPQLTFEGRPVVRLGPIEETDDAYSVTAVLEAGEDRVTAAVVSWAKTPFDAWWRQKSRSISPNVDLPGIAYAIAMPRATSCTADSWAIPVPAARHGHTAVWTGSEMIVWGGIDSDDSRCSSGGRYDPSTDAWTETSVGASVPSPREGHSAVWTGSEMIVWGGYAGTSRLQTGARYNPTTDTWTATSTGPGVPSPRSHHTAVWTGSTMVVWGGADGTAALRTGSRFDPSANTWSATSTGAGVPLARSDHSAVWTGSRMIVWGGTNGSSFFLTGSRYDPVANTWASTSAAAGVPAARSSHTAVWTGSEMIVWGGIGGTPLNSGGRYSPSTNTWAATGAGPGVPSARSGHTAVWTGARMIIWGGADLTTRFDDGGVYDPGAGLWSAVGSNAAPLSARDGHSAVWTGAEMIVWGGLGVVADVYAKAENTGARYSPPSDTWVPTRPNDPAARELHTAVWTGSEMIVWGGWSDAVTDTPLNTGGLYDPSTSSWRKTSVEAETPAPRYRHAAVWTGTKMIVWGGYLESSEVYTPTDTGGRYDPMTDHWSPTTTIGAPSARWDPEAIWTGSVMFVWGGGNETGFLTTGGRYDPSADLWTPTAVDGAPQGRNQHTMVWTGSRAIVWGGLGYDGSNVLYLDSGGLYDPSADSWSPTGTGPGHPTGRTRHTAVWTGGEMIVWGGGCGTGCTVGSTGGRYDPSTDGWTPTSEGINVPSPRSSHTAIWTGHEMIVWGGDRGGPGTGGRYDPAADFWQPTNTVGAPLERARHTAVDTGTEMIVWGGVGTYVWPFGDGGGYCYACTSSTWYRDSDGDGYGDPAASTTSCVQPPGYVANAGDCNDASATTHPGAIEICDGLDNDCNVATDEPCDPRSRRP